MSATVEVTSAVLEPKLRLASHSAAGRKRVTWRAQTRVLAATTAAIAITSAIVPEEVETSETALPNPAPASREAFPFVSSARLWQILKTAEAELAAKVDALDELADRRDADLSGFIATSLDAPRSNLVWRARMVHVAERIDHADPLVRKRLLSGLLHTARLFRDASTAAALQPALWSALRTLGGLIPTDETSCVLEFLRSADAPSTRQAALQALQNILGGASGAESLTPAVRERVTEVAMATLDERHLLSPEGLSLAANAVATAKLANVTGVPHLDARLVRLKRPALERQVKMILERTRNQGRPRP